MIRSRCFSPATTLGGYFIRERIVGNGGDSSSKKVFRKDNPMNSRTICTELLFLIALFALITGDCSKNSPSIIEPTDTTKTATISIADPQQVIRGFGGVNMPGWPAVGDLTADQVNKAFGKGDGQIGMSILRIRVPYDETKFILEAPTAKLVKSLGVTTIFASPWTPPDWMKSNNNIVGGTLTPVSYTAYARHLKAFADFMSGNGAPLYAISIQNEPDASVDYESCSWNASQILTFVKFYAPAIGTRIIAPESENFNHSLSDPILNDSVAAENVSIIGGHIYGGGLSSYPLAVSKGKEVWMTEHLVVDTDWDGALATAKEIHDCFNAGMNAYVWWYIRRYYGPIDESGNVTKRGFVMSQYARFIRPGFVRISATASPQPNVDVTAYKSDSVLVIVALNRNSTAKTQPFALQGGTVTSFTPYVTSSFKNCAQGNSLAVTKGVFTPSLEASSVTTLVSNSPPRLNP